MSSRTKRSSAVTSRSFAQSEADRVATFSGYFAGGEVLCTFSAGADVHRAECMSGRGAAFP